MNQNLWFGPDQKHNRGSGSQFLATPRVNNDLPGLIQLGPEQSRILYTRGNCHLPCCLNTPSPQLTEIQKEKCRVSCCSLRDQIKPESRARTTGLLKRNEAEKTNSWLADQRVWTENQSQYRSNRVNQGQTELTETYLIQYVKAPLNAQTRSNTTTRYETWSDTINHNRSNMKPGQNSWSPADNF